MYTGLPVQYYFEWLSGSKLILQSSLREFDVIGHRWVWSLATVGLLLDDVTTTIVAGCRTKKTHSTQWTISTSCRRNTLCTDRDLEETPIITRVTTRVTTRVAWKTPPVHRLHNWRSSMKTLTRQEYTTYRALCAGARCPFVGLCLSVRLSRAYFNCIAGVPSAYSVESFDVMSYAAAVTHTFRAQPIDTRINADQLTIIQTVVDDACRTSRGLAAIESRALIRYCSTVLSVCDMHAHWHNGET